MKYKIKNQIYKKALKEVRNHPLPTLLMVRTSNDEIRRLRNNEGRDREDQNNSEDIQMPTYDGDRY